MADEKKFLNLHGASYLKDKIVEYLKGYTDTKVSETITQYASIYNFPNVGEVNKLYIDKSTNKIYRWDDEDTKYYTAETSSLTDIDVINGGNSN